MIERFEKIVISVMNQNLSTKLHARSSVLIKAWLRADRECDNSSHYSWTVSYRSIVAGFNDVQPHSLPLPVIQCPSPVPVRYVSYIFSETHKIIIGDLLVWIVFWNAILSVWVLTISNFLEVAPPTGSRLLGVNPAGASISGDIKNYWAGV